MNSNIENTGLKKLKEAFREINQWVYENLHLDTLEEVIPSTRYRKRMERLIKRQKQLYWKCVNTVGKRVAVFAVAIALIFALSMSVYAVREPVVEFFVNVYEKFVEFFYDEDDIAKAPDTIETVYSLGYVPEGYELENYEIGKYSTKFVFKNHNGDKISFSQNLMISLSCLDNENSNFEVLLINGKQVAYTQKANIMSYMWNANGYTFSLYLPREILQEDIVEIITNIMEY